jgi:nucleotide-binding universal stress UspA family protein
MMPMAATQKAEAGREVSESAGDRPSSAGDRSQFRDVLCAVDGTQESLAAVGQAAALAGPSGHLTLLAVTSFSSEAAYRGPAIGPAQAKRMLDSALQVANDARVPSTVEVDPAGPPARVILDWAAERHLLAMGATATSWFGAMFTGGVAVAAEGSFTTPLLVARSTTGEQRFGHRIVVASDGLAGSDELVDLAGSLAQAQGSDLILLHALASEARRRRVEGQAGRLQLALDGASEVELKQGSARAVIVETAGEVGASLVVMSSRRLRGVRAVGSVSRRVIHQGHCSVLLVPPEYLLGA